MESSEGLWRARLAYAPIQKTVIIIIPDIFILQADVGKPNLPLKPSEVVRLYHHGGQLRLTYILTFEESFWVLGSCDALTAATVEKMSKTAETADLCHCQFVILLFCNPDSCLLATGKNSTFSVLISCWRCQREPTPTGLCTASESWTTLHPVTNPL